MFVYLEYIVFIHIRYMNLLKGKTIFKLNNE